MKRKLATWMMLAAVGGWFCSASQAGKYMSGTWTQPTEGASWGARHAPEVPGYVGPYGVPIHQMAPGGSSEPTGADFAKAHLAQQYPSALMQQVGMPPPPPGLVPGTAGSGIVRTGGNVPQYCHPGQEAINNPNIQGVPGIVPPGPPGAVAALGALTGGPPMISASRTEVRFAEPAGMKISWYAPRTDGKAGFTTQFLEAPARYNFLQSAIYRLKLSDIPNRPGVDLYPTLEIVPCNPKTATFLAHSAVPISFTQSDFDEVAGGNFVVKVIYLPDPQFQNLAVTGLGVISSTLLQPGEDPILEAKRLGTILAIVRLGNIDLEAPNTPAMDAPDPKAVAAQQYQAMMMQQQQQAAMMAQQAAMRQGGMPPGMPGGMGGGMGGGMMGMLPPGLIPPGPAGAAMGPMRPGMMPPGMMPPGMTPPGAPPATAPAPGSPIGKETTAPTPAPAQRTTLVDLAGKMFK